MITCQMTAQMLVAHVAPLPVQVAAGLLDTLGPCDISPAWPLGLSRAESQPRSSCRSRG
jgi:hypothetical protein